MSRAVGKSFEIFLISADGGSPHQLLSESTPELDPTWSADGGQLAFGTGADFSGKSEIKVVDMKTRQVSTLAGSIGMFSPRWSPDGRYLAALPFDISPGKLFLYDFRTGKWAEWIADRDIGYLAWMADSRSVEYVRDDGVDNDANVRRVKIGGSQIDDLFGLAGLSRYLGPAGPWSDTAPDGSWMCLRNQSGQDIYALDADFP